jgi:hypothetical protein
VAKAVEQRREWPAECGGNQRHAKAAARRQYPGQQVAHQPVLQRALVGFLDAHPRLVDQVHVIDAGRAGRHAGEAGQAAVDMQRDFAGSRLVVLQHVLDQVDAAARRIELVAELQIGRASGGAEAAMDAAPQDGVASWISGSASWAREKEVCIMCMATRLRSSHGTRFLGVRLELGMGLRPLLRIGR